MTAPQYFKCTDPYMNRSFIIVKYSNHHIFGVWIAISISSLIQIKPKNDAYYSQTMANFVFQTENQQAEKVNILSILPI